VAGDTLSWTDQIGILASYNTATGVLALSGNATLATYEALLRSVAYSSSSEDPTANATRTSRTLTWSLTDANSDLAGAGTGTATTTVNLTASTDAPVLGGAGSTVAYTENGGPITLESALTVGDADDTEIASGTVTISAGSFVAGDTLSWTNQAGILASYNAATGVLALSGNATLATYEALLRSVAYSSSSEDPTANATRTSRTLTWSLTDANSDAAGAGTGTATTTVNLTATADPPVMTAGASVGYTENAAAVAIDSTITVSDADDTEIGGATVSISAGFTAGDVLGFVGLGPISGSYNAATGVLALTGTDTLANYQAALRSVTYLSTSEDPTALSPSRTISWQVTDADSDGLGPQTSALVASSISVTAINDAPTLSATATDPTFTEDGAAANPFSGALVSTIETGQTIDQIVLAVTNVADGAAEVLTIDGSDLALTNGNSVLTAGNGMSAAVSLAGSTATVTVSRPGGISAGAMQALLDALGYRNTSQDPSTADRVITLTSIRDSGGTANGGADTAALGIASTVAVVAVNDAPVLGPVTLSIDPQQTVTLTGANMSASDVDDPPASLVFLVGGVANGRFELAGAPGVAIASFTQAQLAAGQVRFVHTDYDFGPSFSIFVTDGAAIVGPGVAVVSFRPPGAEAPAPPRQPDPAPTVTEVDSGVLLTSGGGFAAPGAAEFIRTPFAPPAPGEVTFAEAPAETPVVLARPVRGGGLLDPRGGGGPGDNFAEADRIPTGLPKVNFGIRAIRHDEGPQRLDVALGSARITGMAVSVGAVWWAARAGGLLASMLASAPAWRHIDPLPVLGRDENAVPIDWGDGEKAVAPEDEQAAQLFGDQPTARSNSQ
jgi:hypothetical protein